MSLSLYTTLAVALITTSCTLNSPPEALEIVGPTIHESSDLMDCGPNEIVEDLDKLVAIPANSAFGLTSGVNKYYPSTERVAIRTYGLDQTEADLARQGASFADFWSPGTSMYNTWSAAEANVHITVSTEYYPACDINYVGGSDECWFGGATCTEYRNTNVSNVRVCEVWRVRLNIGAMYLFVDSRGLSRENIVQAVSAHEVGHTMGLRHRAGTIMASGTPIPGYNGRTWETLPRFDACQTESLLDYVVDDSSEIIYMPNPVECE